MALIHGLMGKFPCPVCLVPHPKALRAQARESTTLEAREQVLSSESLRDVNVVSISFSDGMKYEDISKLIVFAAHNVFKRDLDPQAYLLLHCIRSYVEFNTYALLEVHTEDMIRDGRNTLLELTELMDEYIHSKMECLDAQNLGSLVVPDPSEVDSDGLESTDEPTDIQHFSLGSQQATKSFVDIEATNCRHIQLAANDMITEFRFIKAESGPIFAKLLLVFTCTVGDVAYPIALTLPYDQPVGTRPQKDKDFKFWQVKAKPRASAENAQNECVGQAVDLVAQLTAEEEETEEDREWRLAEEEDERLVREVFSKVSMPTLSGSSPVAAESSGDTSIEPTAPQLVTIKWKVDDIEPDLHNAKSVGVPPAKKPKSDLKNKLGIKIAKKGKVYNDRLLGHGHSCVHGHSVNQSIWVII
ncbi:uncharacterized protein EDB91DRAFT_1085462 [Suillus paluster]|uniref:uncharacterized protein n=1 Tax=Suillus paluster TaxID=48578 RepID=UPI001B86080F|nr:uncharacterized protein EDB91DRAFT_1085462 [Suillus paluster]KAG1730407.1 hypothetical protein EDB91DRAFT_1085462 [Suillus paluster]